MTDKRASASTVRDELTAARKRWDWSPSDIVNLLRGGGNSSKGSEYEREMCRLLSHWWTYGVRDDIFWRSSGSGARAKVRGRRGVDTAGQHGDIAATDPIGAPFIRYFTVEIKRGYTDFTAQDLIDRLPKAGVQEWESWFAQTLESHKQAGSKAWLLITRRDRREALVWFPFSLLGRLRGAGAFEERPLPFCRITTLVRTSSEALVVDACCTTLSSWLGGVRPEHVLTISRREGLT